MLSTRVFDLAGYARGLNISALRRGGAGCAGVLGRAEEGRCGLRGGCSRALGDARAALREAVRPALRGPRGCAREAVRASDDRRARRWPPSAVLPWLTCAGRSGRLAAGGRSWRLMV